MRGRASGVTEHEERGMTEAVSRETPSLPSPEELGRAFPVSRHPLIARYAELLATEGVVRGLIGPREAPRLWERHLFNCALLGEGVPEGATVCDIGSGAGLPGLVLAIARPDLQITLVEPLLRRTTFLSEVVEELDLTNVTVVRGRADALHGKERFDVVTSRAVAALETLLDWSMPLVAPEGSLVAMKGSSIAEEIETARPRIKAWELSEPEIIPVGEDGAGTTLLRVSWAQPSRVGFPVRVPGAPGGSQKTRKKNKGKRR